MNRCSKCGRPKGSIKPDAKQQVSLRLDKDVIAHFRETGLAIADQCGGSSRLWLRNGGARMPLAPFGQAAYIAWMDKKVNPLENSAAGKALLKRELECGLASGVSKRSPEQVRAAFRKAREAA